MNPIRTLARLLPIALPLCLVAGAAQSQDNTGFRIGIKAGATYANIAGDEVEDLAGPNYDSDLGKRHLDFNVGVSFMLPISSDGFFALQPEVLLNRKGYNLEVEQKSSLPPGVSKFSFEQNRALTYIDVPVLARVNADKLFFVLGPQFGYLARASSETETTTKFTNGSKDDVDKDTGDSKSDLASFDFGGVAGLGYQSPFGLSLELRYNRGFNSLIDTKDVDNEPKAFNDAFMLQVGYWLPIGK